jgi:hypothetical protein
MFHVTVVDCPRLIDAGDAEIEATVRQEAAPFESVEHTVAKAPTTPAMTIGYQARALLAAI